MSGIDLARRAACALITGVLDERQTLAEQIGAEALDGLSPSERARAQRLALDCLRNLPRVEAMLKPHLRRRPPADVLALLRLGTTELCVEGVPAHGVVNAAVALVHSGGRRVEGYAGLVNAVLRKVAEDSARWSALPVPALPGWLRGRLMSAWGKVAVMRMEEAHLAGAPLDLTARGDAAALAGATGGQLLPTGSVRLASGTQVTALDISEGRLERLRENLDRCRLSAEVIAADALIWEPERRFDAILLDAPCSATGTIRRHPDLPQIKQSSDIRDLVALQAALLDRALGWLKPGGRLVYCTCSLLPDEGEAQIAAALVRHPGLSVEPVEIAGTDPEWHTGNGALRLRPDYWPEMGGMDGFFIARLRP